MKIEFSCINCGQTKHKETIVNGERIIICSNCGEKYITASALRELEKQREEQAATAESL